MRGTLINLAYVVAAVLFILGLKGLTHPRSAVRGNLIGSIGMLIAIVATLIGREIISYSEIVVGLAIGSAAGAILAWRVKMTAMPELVAVLNGFGGAASALVAASELLQAIDVGIALPARPITPLGAAEISEHAALTISIGATGLVGAVTLTGSLIAFAKLAELDYKFKPLSARIPGSQYINGGLLLACIGLIAAMVVAPSASVFWALLAVSSILGVTLTVPIGGGDMPVVIALMNSYSGVAAAAAGFVLKNNALIISGSLVGSSGVILTAIMCKAMNRSLTNVLFGAVGIGDAAGRSVDEVYKTVKATSGDEIAMLLEDARRVVIVPGYGMAVSQAQHAVRELMTILEKRGTAVEFAIHPVAGRMPGHMNVLLAESDVPYEKMIEMDAINPTMAQCDVAIVIGANDVVNPDARTDPNSPLAGMPIIDVDKASTVVVVKRSLSPGFAKVPNPLFAAENTLMFFEDGKQAMVQIQTALNEL